jgi:hypothetical protein
MRLDIQRSTDLRSAGIVLGIVLIATGTFTSIYGMNYFSDGLSDSVQRLLSNVHRHKDLLPLDTSDVWGTIFTTVGLMVAASGGIGGGGILVPLFILVFGFSPKYAIPLSNFCILGSSITNMILNLVKRHPMADRPLVDWDLILVMEPLTMAGAVSRSPFFIIA